MKGGTYKRVFYYLKTCSCNVNATPQKEKHYAKFS